MNHSGLKIPYKIVYIPRPSFIKTSVITGMTYSSSRSVPFKASIRFVISFLALEGRFGVPSD